MARKINKKIKKCVKTLKEDGRANGWNLHLAGGYQQDGEDWGATLIHKMNYPDGQKPLSCTVSMNVRTNKVTLSGDMDPITDQFKMQDSPEAFRHRKGLAAQVWQEGTDIDDYEPEAQRGGLHSEVPTDLVPPAQSEEASGDSEEDQ